MVKGLQLLKEPEDFELKKLFMCLLLSFSHDTAALEVKAGAEHLQMTDSLPGSKLTFTPPSLPFASDHKQPHGPAVPVLLCGAK